MEQAMLSVTQAAVFLNTTENGIYKLMRRKALPYRRLGRKVVFLRDDLQRWMQGLDGLTVEDALKTVKALPARETANLAAALTTDVAAAPEVTVSLKRGPQPPKLPYADVAKGGRAADK